MKILPGSAVINNRSYFLRPGPRFSSNDIVIINAVVSDLAIVISTIANDVLDDSLLGGDVATWWCYVITSSGEVGWVISSWIENAW